MMVVTRFFLFQTTLLFATSAVGGNYCGNLPRNSAAYFSCESLNQQEQVELERNRKQKDQEEKDSLQMRSDALLRLYKDAEDRETNKSQEKASRDREYNKKLDADRALRTERDERERSQVATDMLPIMMGILNAVKSSKDGDCTLAQKILDEARTKTAFLRPTYTLNGEELNSDTLRDAIVAAQISIFESCLKNPARSDKTLAFLKREAKAGNKAAQVILAQKGESKASEVKRPIQGGATQEVAVTNKVADTKECKSMFQAWVFNELLEEGCGFKLGIARRAGFMIKSWCPEITDEQRGDWGKEVLVAMKKDYDEIGLGEMCSRNKAAYEALAN